MKACFALQPLLESKIGGGGDNIVHGKYSEGVPMPVDRSSNLVAVVSVEMVL
jgi:hypothetical protein